MRLLRWVDGWLIALLLAVVALDVAAADTRLLDAIKDNDVAVVRSLLHQQVDVNAPAPDGATALHWAAYLENSEVATLLVQAGADVTAANRYGVTPLSLACTNGDAELVKSLLEAGADPNDVGAEGETALMTAARTGNVDVVKQLLAHGAQANRKEGWRGQTALMWAAAEGHLDVVDTLIGAGSDIYGGSNEGFTPLLFAVRQGQMDVVRALVKAGADPNEIYQTPDGSDDQAGAASSGRFPKPRSGTSVLFIAVANAHYELAAMLLDMGADPNGAAQGWTALHTITWIRKSGGGNNTPAPNGSGNMSSHEFIRYIAQRGADLNAQVSSKVRVGDSVLNTLGATPFLLAARTADAEMMRLLAELGADPVLPNADNSTPLMVAAGLGTRSPGEDAGTESEVVEAVKVALELGNDIDTVDNNGETAMHGAAYKQLPAVVSLLAESGADMEIWNQKNSSGWTPLRIAAGVFRTSNFRFSDPATAVVRELMSAAGVSTELEPVAAPQPVDTQAIVLPKQPWIQQ
jgi:ankyrin repeat protein